MMMTGPIFFAASWLMRSSAAFSFTTNIPSAYTGTRIRCTSRLFSAPSDVTAAAVYSGVSRIQTLQTLLEKFGAPGSIGCTESNDLSPVITLKDTPELVDSLVPGYDDDLLDLHPHLFPLAKSSKSGNFVCALRRAYADDASYESSSDAPWPIVETQLGAPGMRLLSLNSEHLMRRIACECDFTDEGGGDAISIYNNGLGSGIVKDSGLDAPYESGSVESLGYGLDKYVLLRVGPFPDLYEKMALQHAERGDESSSLIAAETANGKFTGFGSTFRFYARLLSSFPQREEESRDAARMCLRLPLPSAGMLPEDFCEIAVLALFADESDSVDVAIEKLRDMYEKIRASEQEDPASSQGKTTEQLAIDEANYILDTVAMTDHDWRSVRSKLGDIYSSAGRKDMAAFVDPSRRS